jgi:hypothetical protein
MPLCVKGFRGFLVLRDLGIELGSWFGGRRVVAGPGVAWPKSRCMGVGAGRAGDRVVSPLPSRARSARARRGPVGVGLDAGEDGVADLPLQRTECLFGCLAVGQLAFVVGPVAMSRLGGPTVTEVDGSTYADGWRLCAVGSALRLVEPLVHLQGELERC